MNGLQNLDETGIIMDMRTLNGNQQSLMLSGLSSVLSWRNQLLLWMISVMVRCCITL